VGNDVTETPAGSHLETDHQRFAGCRGEVLRKVNGAWKEGRCRIVLDANVLLDKTSASASKPAEITFGRGLR
jgi:hypothetical protein